MTIINKREYNDILKSIVVLEDIKEKHSSELSFFQIEMIGVAIEALIKYLAAYENGF